MNPLLLSEAIDDLDSRFIEEALNKTPKKRLPPRLLWASVAVAACLIVTTAVLANAFVGNTLPLSSASHNVSVSVVEDVCYQDITVVSDLPKNIKFSSQQTAMSVTDLNTGKALLFAEHDEIFKGTIIQSQVIDIDFSGAHYYAVLADIDVLKVYQGTATEGTRLSILLPITSLSSSRLSHLIISDTTPQAGATLIFMPTKLDTSHTLEKNGGFLQLTDLAQYGLKDPNCFAFF